MCSPETMEVRLGLELSDPYLNCAFRTSQALEFLQVHRLPTRISRELLLACFTFSTQTTPTWFTCPPQTTSDLNRPLAALTNQKSWVPLQTGCLCRLLALPRTGLSAWDQVQHILSSTSLTWKTPTWNGS